VNATQTNNPGDKAMTKLTKKENDLLKTLNEKTWTLVLSKDVKTVSKLAARGFCRFYYSDGVQAILVSGN
jgi:hypothetical protein